MVDDFAPDDATLAELDRLSAASKEQPDDLDRQVALWTAVANLDHWFLINRGTAEAFRPYALAADAGTLVAIYSSAARAREGAIANGLVDADETTPGVSVPLPSAIDWALSLGENGVTGLVIDYPQNGSWCPLPNLVRLRAMRESGTSND